jgi:hypothetical protein
VYRPLAMYTSFPGFRVTGQQQARRTVGEGTPIPELIDSCRKSVVAASQKIKQAEMLRSHRPKGGGVLISGGASRSVLKCARSALEPGLSVGTVCAQKTPDVDHV